MALVAPHLTMSLLNRSPLNSNSSLSGAAITISTKMFSREPASGCERTSETMSGATLAKGCHTTGTAPRENTMPATASSGIGHPVEPVWDSTQ